MYKAFILAAGLGTRMRPLTDHYPKPMVSVAGRSLIWRILDKLGDAGINEVVVNLHYMADILAGHLQEYMVQNPDMLIHLSFEEGILDTGGGVRNALDYFDDEEPFYVIAGDALWNDKDSGSALETLSRNWDSSKMDILTLMQPLNRMKLTRGVGDYDLLDSGLARRSHDKSGSHMWSNIRLNSKSIYKNITEESFSFLKIMDECEKNGRLYAIEYQGDWHHVSTPQDLEAVSKEFDG